MGVEQALHQKLEREQGYNLPQTRRTFLKIGRGLWNPARMAWGLLAASSVMRVAPRLYEVASCCILADENPTAL